jgi:hypothetical protein
MNRPALLLASTLLAFGACKGGSDEQPAEPALPAPAAVTPAAVTPADVQRLRWLEGTWKGTGDGTQSFYEAYRFVDDATIQTLTYTDSSLSQVADSGRIALSGGVLTSRGGAARWVATELDSTHVHFEPQENAQNAFTWTFDTPDAWTAVLRWASSERVYRMERIGPVPVTPAAAPQP